MSSVFASDAAGGRSLSAATQQQCSSGNGACNGVCGGGRATDAFVEHAAASEAR